MYILIARSSPDAATARIGLDRWIPAGVPTSTLRRRPSPIAPAAASRRRRGAIPFLAISIALVAILAGRALFLSGYSSAARPRPSPARRPPRATAFQPFWDTYHTISDRYAGGEVDRTPLVQGAIRG